MSEWREFRLGDISCLEYGKMPKQKLIGNGNYITFSGYKYLDIYPDYNCEEGDVIVVARGVGGTGDVKLVKQKCYLTNLSIKISLNNFIVDNSFFYYFFKKDNLRYLDSGSAQSQITIKDLSDERFNFPPLPEQKAIAGVLSSLDDKIDLLHRQNKTLEAMAEALFRQWFVEEAEEGWEEIELGDVIETTSGGTPSRKNMTFFENGTIHWVKSKELNGTFIFDTEEMISENALKSSSAKMLPENSILIAMYGATVGEYAIISKPMACNQAVCALKPSDDYPYTYLFLLIKHNKEELINMAVGSAQQNISQQLIKKIPIWDCTERIKQFHLNTFTYFEKIKTNQCQIHNLEKLRDSLLPKLMSGEVRIKGV